MRLGDTPVPIPNTMVKASAADGTMLATAWESRWLPDLKIAYEVSLQNLLCASHKKILMQILAIHRRTISVGNGGVAQLGEHLPCKQGVKSSNLSVSTSEMKISLTELNNRVRKCELS